MERPSPVPVHPCRVYKSLQALHRLLNLLTSVLPLVAHLAAQLLKIPSGRSTTNPSLVRVTAVRGRVLCTQFHGENDDNFIFCQWCAATQREDQTPDDECTLHRDEEALTTHLQQFQTFINSSSSAVRRDATALAFEQFLASRKSSLSKESRRHNLRTSSRFSVG